MFLLQIIIMRVAGSVYKIDVFTDIIATGVMAIHLFYSTMYLYIGMPAWDIMPYRLETRYEQS